eukprot:TRINITY_DN17406_c0_g1_i1.p1 TRINITY_DN17406_c0_g1~~TRINITY_DN17406_c0_g1_i1.p1  ORF type:complete len:381 (+),score=36.28 TRINITY_DN17406_c0_g1_i1:63-1205(+)
MEASSCVRRLARRVCGRKLQLAPQVRQVHILVNSEALRDVRDAGNLNHGVPAGRPGNNNPERRRNLVIQALSQDGSLPATLSGCGRANDLSVAEAVHSKGFLHFLGSVFRRWDSELHRDSSFVLPSPADASDVGLVPFHSVKADHPRGPGLPAEFACYASDFETPIYESTAATLVGDLGLVSTAVQQVLEDGQPVYALCTNPGHHAGPTYFSGFCYINNACVACALLERAGKQPALLDLDFHGGNGSYDIAVPKDWWFRSINCANVYPWVDMGRMGVDLSAGTTWQGGYAEALQAVLRELPESVGVLVVSLGYDTLATDPESTKRVGSGLGLTPSDFEAMAACLVSTGLPVLVVQEGGYDLANIPSAASKFISGLAVPKQ